MLLTRKDFSGPLTFGLSGFHCTLSTSIPIQQCEKITFKNFLSQGEQSHSNITIAINRAIFVHVDKIHASFVKKFFFFKDMHFPTYSCDTTWIIEQAESDQQHALKIEEFRRYYYLSGVFTR
jgi:hypothetical protein